MQAAHGKGRILAVRQYAWPDVTPAYVAAAIAAAVEGGWRPDEPGPPFSLDGAALHPPAPQADA